MMGGIDTVMPDKIVKRVINGILEKAGYEPVNNDLEFVEKAEKIALECGYRPIELCWMTWLIQPEGEMMRASYRVIQLLGEMRLEVAVGFAVRRPV